MYKFKFFSEKFEAMKRCPNTYYVTVIEDTRNRRIIGAATLFVEHKFIHGCGTVCVFTLWINLFNRKSKQAFCA